MTIKGKLEPFFETGTEGIIWSVTEDGKEGYDSLHSLDEGDLLTVLVPDGSGAVVWEGNINYEWKRNFRNYPGNPDHGQQEIGGMWVHGIQENVEPDDWGMWFYKQYPCELVKAGIGRLSPAKSSTILGYRWTGTGSPWNNVKDTGDLIVKFKSGYYRYKDVDTDTFWGFYESESLGKYHAANIKNKFTAEKLVLPSRPRYGTNPPKPWRQYVEELKWTPEEEEEFVRMNKEQK